MASRTEGTRISCWPVQKGKKKKKKRLYFLRTRKCSKLVLSLRLTNNPSSKLSEWGRDFLPTARRSRTWANKVSKRLRVDSGLTWEAQGRPQPLKCKCLFSAGFPRRLPCPRALSLRALARLSLRQPHHTPQTAGLRDKMKDPGRRGQESYPHLSINPVRKHCHVSVHPWSVCLGTAGSPARVPNQPPDVALQSDQGASAVSLGDTARAEASTTSRTGNWPCLEGWGQGGGWSGRPRGS